MILDLGMSLYPNYHQNPLKMFAPLLRSDTNTGKLRVDLNPWIMRAAVCRRDYPYNAEIFLC